MRQKEKWIKYIIPAKFCLFIFVTFTSVQHWCVCYAWTRTTKPVWKFVIATLYLLQLVVNLITNIKRKRFLSAQTLQTLGDQMQVWKRVWIFEVRSENGCEKWHFWSELGLDLEMRTAHPHQKFQGVPPRRRS